MYCFISSLNRLSTITVCHKWKIKTIVGVPNLHCGSFSLALSKRGVSWKKNIKSELFCGKIELMAEQVAKWTWNCIVIGVMTRAFYHSCSLFNDWSCHNCLLSFPFFITCEQSMNLRLVKFYQRWMKPKTPVHCRNWIDWNRV